MGTGVIIIRKVHSYYKTLLVLCASFIAFMWCMYDFLITYFMADEELSVSNGQGLNVKCVIISSNIPCFSGRYVM